MSTMIQRRLFNVEEYCKMEQVGILAADDRTELINGEIIKMSPINRPHAYFVGLLAEVLVSDLRYKAYIGIQSTLYINEYSMPQPDIYVARFREDRYKNNHPSAEDTLLIIELADSSRRFDQKVKLKLYAKAGIPEYWIVNIPDEQLEIYRDPTGEKYALKEVIKKGKEHSLKILDYDFNPAVLFS